MSSARTPSTCARIRRRSSAAAASPTSTRRPARRRSTSRRRRRTHTDAVRDRGGFAGEHPDHQPRPRRRVRQQGADLPRVRRHDRGVLSDRPSAKWVEDRTGNLISTGFARDYHMRGELAVKGGKMTGLRAFALSDQGALRRRPADEVPGGAVPHRHRLVRHPGGARGRGRLVHEQGARRRRVPLLVPRHRGLVPDRAPRRQRATSWASIPRGSGSTSHPAGAVPVPP